MLTSMEIDHPRNRRRAGGSRLRPPAIAASIVLSLVAVLAFADGDAFGTAGVTVRVR